MRSARALTIAGLVAGACSSYEQGTTAVTAGDPASYAIDVQPIITDSCATLDCHGAPGRPLRLYSEYGLRLRRELRPEPMTGEELDRNIWSFAAISAAAASVEDDLSLLKPLAVEAGGVQHVGGDLWTSTDDGDYQAMRRWLETSR